MMSAEPGIESKDANSWSPIGAVVASRVVDGVETAYLNDVETKIFDDDDGEDAFEVRWDGDYDPANPRSRSTARKWVVVLILAMSSLCA
jgi:hypothetical protein